VQCLKSLLRRLVLDIDKPVVVLPLVGNHHPARETANWNQYNLQWIEAPGGRNESRSSEGDADNEENRPSQKAIMAADSNKFIFVRKCG
jgi:hypothetical protein